MGSVIRCSMHAVGPRNSGLDCSHLSLLLRPFEVGAACPSSLYTISGTTSSICMTEPSATPSSAECKEIALAKQLALDGKIASEVEL